MTTGVCFPIFLKFYKDQFFGKSRVEDADRAPSVIQQVKIVAKPIKIEEHRGLPYWCPTCQCFHDAPMPKEVEHGGLFDAKLTAIVAYMKGVCHASYSTIRKFLRDVLGTRVARSYLKKILEKVSDSLESVYHDMLFQKCNQSDQLVVTCISGENVRMIPSPSQVPSLIADDGCHLSL